ncbi:MAG: trypsin-like peptidase domain-containing protein [Nanoarchaeota archaeon]|nr:trypsin-like peptidase domain-containing protein [Nanoarchaeota archaeon]
MEKHANILYILVLFLLIFQLISFVFVTIQFSKLNSKIDVEVYEAKKGLTENFNSVIDDYNNVNQRNFNDLSLAITKQGAQQKSFEDEISLLKVTQDDFSSVIDKAVKNVVAVLTENSVGSGFIIAGDGHLITNYHVIQGKDNIRVLTYDKQALTAEIIGIDKLRDLALLKIEGDYDYLPLADSDSLQVGRKVIAIGNPLGLSFTVTEGIISGLDREGPNGLEEYVQTDVSLNPGNSGGPLISTQGEVIGMNNFKIGDAESLGFALESNSIKSSINSMVGENLIK